MDWTLRYRLRVWIYAEEIEETVCLLYEVYHVGQRMRLQPRLWMGITNTSTNDVLGFALCGGISHVERFLCGLPIYR